MKGQTMVQCLKQIKLKWVENSDSQPWASLCQHEATVTLNAWRKQNKDNIKTILNTKSWSGETWWNRNPTVNSEGHSPRSETSSEPEDLSVWISPVHEIRFLLSTKREYIKSFFATVIFHIEAVSSTNMYTNINIFVDINYIYICVQYNHWRTKM